MFQAYVPDYEFRFFPCGLCSMRDVDIGSCFCCRHPHEIEQMCAAIFLSTCIYLYLIMCVCVSVYAVYTACICMKFRLHWPLCSEKTNGKSCKQSQYNRSIYFQPERKQENNAILTHTYLGNLHARRIGILQHY